MDVQNILNILCASLTYCEFLGSYLAINVFTPKNVSEFATNLTVKKSLCVTCGLD